MIEMEIEKLIAPHAHVCVVSFFYILLSFLSSILEMAKVEKNKKLSHTYLGIPFQIIRVAVDLDEKIGFL